MVKFDRNYTFFAETRSGTTIVIEPPFTLEFDITKNVLTSANVCQIRLYNLSRIRRSELRFDISNFGELRSIRLNAGYGNNMPIIFSGNITQAWSVREGVNFITQIECLDGGFAFTNGTVELQAISGSDQEGIIRALASGLPNITLGIIGQSFKRDPVTHDVYRISRGNSYNGNTVDQLIDTVGDNNFFVDNAEINFLSTDETFIGDLEEINSQSGLLGTPTREDYIIHFEMLFEPRIKIGQLVEINIDNGTSLPSDTFNGRYKVVSVKHRGIISAAVCGDAVTSVGCFRGVNDLSVQVKNG